VAGFRLRDTAAARKSIGRLSGPAQQGRLTVADGVGSARVISTAAGAYAPPSLAGRPAARHQLSSASMSMRFSTSATPVLRRAIRSASCLPASVQSSEPGAPRRRCDRRNHPAAQ
jgi:hypothetical protein